MSKFKAILSIFTGGPKIPAPQPLPPPVTIADPAIADAKERLRKSELARKGRAASILTSGQGVTDELGTTDNPTARGGATVLGGTS